MKNLMEKFKARVLIEETYEWRKWTKEIPFINLPDTYSIKVIPPFGGAVARFLVAAKDDQKNSVSVYLDCYGELGAMYEPYWEIYPYNGDIYRCVMNDTDELIEKIEESINAFNK